jgi:L-aspartate oxidase
VPPADGLPATPGARRALQAAMWDGVGVERDATGLAAAAAALESIHPGDDPETGNLLLVARLTAAAADIRTESRGAHYRSDFPLPDPAQVRRIAWVGGEPYLVRHARQDRALALEAA